MVSLRRREKIGNGGRRECLAVKEKEGEGKREREKERKGEICFMPEIFFLIPILLTIKFSNML